MMIMNHIRNIAFGLLLALVGATGAQAQCGSGQFRTGQFCGYVGANPLGLPGPVLITPSVFQPIAGGTVIGNPTGASAVPVATAVPVLGIPGSVQGSLGLAGATSGTITVKGLAAAGTYNFNLPTAAGTAGQPLLSGGGGAAAMTFGTLQVPAGGTGLVSGTPGGLPYFATGTTMASSAAGSTGQVMQSNGGAAPTFSTATYPSTTTINQLLYSSAANTVTGLATVNGGLLNAGATGVPAMTVTPVLGVPGASQGTLGFAGLTSGTATITAQATAGTVTLTLPNTSGTFAVGATTPLALSATTGGLTCPTCVTSSGGGAITGTAPISVSAAGVVSITSPLPLTNGGTNASLTASNGGIVWSNGTQLQILAGTATARLPVLSGASATPVFGAFTLPASVTSGGIPYFSSTSAESSSALLTANAIMLGGGAGAAPATLASLGTTTTVLHGNAAGAPTFAQIVAGDVTTNTLTNATLAQAAAFTLKGNSTASTANVADFTIGSLTNKASPTGADLVMISDQAASGALKQTTLTQLIAGVGTGVTSIAGNTGAFTLSQPLNNATNALVLNATIFPEGRLTLTSATPVMTASVTAATTVYYTPYVGNLMPIYDGTNVIPNSLAEVSVVLGSNWTTNSNWDVFIASDSGTLRACTGPAWTSSTARGTGAGTTELERVNGLVLNKVSLTCRYNNTTTFTVAADRGTYVGSFRTAAAGQVNYIFGAVAANGTAADFGIWNMYNRVRVATMVGDNTDTWTYGSANTWRAANGSSTIRVSAIRGFDEDGIEATYQGFAASGAGAIAASGVGLDSTTGFSGSTFFTSQTAFGLALPAKYSGLMGLGYHYVSAIEYNSTATASSWYGDNGFTFFQTGLHAVLAQ